MKSPTPAAAVIAALVLLTGGSVQAQNWEFVPRVQAGYEYNDNYRLDIAGDEIDVSGAFMDALLPLRLVDPTKKAEIAPRVRATYFPDDKEEDSTDYYLTGLYEQRTERQVFGIDGEISREDVVRSELPSTEVDGNLGEPSTGDSGRVLRRNERDLIRVDPYWQYDVSQRHRAEAGGYYFDAKFKNNFEGEQQDFTDYGVYAGWGWRFSPRSTLTLRGRTSRYETNFDSEGYGAEIEWRSNYSETAHIYVRLGGQQTEQDRAGSSAKTSVIAGAGGRWTWPTTTLFADLTRNVGPTSAGAVVERNQLRLRLLRAIQPRLSLIAGARAQRDEAVDTPTYPTREYLTGEFGFDWRFTRQWSVIGMYHYIWQEYSDEPADRSSNAITIGVSFEPRRVE